MKVREINLERGRPAAETAVRDMVGQLGTGKRQGLRAVILIHGYGSSGTGGSIRAAVREKLRESSLRGLVRDWCGGENWIHRKWEMIGLCGELAQYQRRIEGNPGVTVVILK
ncbi:hypothetical protein [Bacilliculturomica massiliensis]|uniref:hypothetical protein n=1 Tax=Bacilliculturomica massiliensis TaxID=1917867 RepID=UPI0010302D4F|nr:hypothetical protein [Bacilliculturomica massiliensis]